MLLLLDPKALCLVLWPLPWGQGGWLCTTGESSSSQSSVRLCSEMSAAWAVGLSRASQVAICLMLRPLLL